MLCQQINEIKQNTIVVLWYYLRMEEFSFFVGKDTIFREGIINLVQNWMHDKIKS
jgi:hypothetical protein